MRKKRSMWIIAGWTVGRGKRKVSKKLGDGRKRLSRLSVGDVSKEGKWKYGDNITGGGTERWSVIGRGQATRNDVTVHGCEKNKKRS